MIVICTKCQAKFRVADDKIGPRGAKVRCSKCQTVFLVHPVHGTMSVTDGDARHVPAPQAAAPAGAAPPAKVPGPPEPFGPASPFAAAPDPFARPAEPAPVPAAARDPFAGDDPFVRPAPPPAPGVAPPSLGDPFVAAVTHRSSLPVTDLSDLMGGAVAQAKPPPLPAARQPARPSPPTPALEDAFAPAAPAAEPPPPLEDDPFAAAALEAPQAPPAPELADLGGAFGAEDPFAAGAPPAGSPADEAPPPSAAFDPGSLALEDRLTPPPSRLAAPPPSPLDQTLETAEPAPPAGSADPFAGFVAPAAAAPMGAAAAAGAGPSFDANAFGAFEFERSAEEPPALADSADVAVAPPAAEPPEAAPPPPPPPSPRRTPAPAGPAAAPAPAPDDAPERIPGARTSRLRTVAVNAVALVALLAVALALWAVWRTEGPLEPASLRPSALLSALGRGGAAGPWVAQDIRSGVYDRVRGAPLLFVRGRVLSRPSAPVVPGVKVAVQVIRAGTVIARGEALAGAVPTEEELYLASDDAALAAATRAARSRVPQAIRAGDAVPFLVALGDAPPDLDGASVRIEVGPAEGTTP